MFDIRSTSGEDACHWFMDKFDLDYVILTAGAAYSTIIISKKGETSTVDDTARVEVVDTVGAGDSFSGTFTARILQGDSLVGAPRWREHLPPSYAPRTAHGRVPERSWITSPQPASNPPLPFFFSSPLFRENARCNFRSGRFFVSWALYPVFPVFPGMTRRPYDMFDTLKAPLTRTVAVPPV